MAAENDESLEDLLAFMDEDAAPTPDISKEEFEALEELTEETPAPEEPKKTRAPRAKKVAEPEPAPVPAAAPVEDAAARRIRELEAELERPLLAPTNDEGRPLPEHELTEEQKKIRELEDQIARRKAQEMLLAQERFEQAQDNAILIHFLEDGFTAQGRVWYRGQELEFPVPGQAYEQTKNRNGDSWLDLADNEMAQVQMYGKVMFRKGPWPGQRLAENEISVEERRRNRAAPIT